MLRTRAGDTMFFSVLHFQHLQHSYHTEVTSTHVCLSLVKTDAAQAAVLARLEPGGWRALWFWSRVSLGRPCVSGAEGVRLFQICLFLLGWPYSPFCVRWVCVSLSGLPVGHPLGPRWDLSPDLFPTLPASEKGEVLPHPQCDS